jgi:hypothetical protein
MSILSGVTHDPLSHRRNPGLWVGEMEVKFTTITDKGLLMNLIRDINNVRKTNHPNAQKLDEIMKLCDECEDMIRNNK